MKRLIWLIIGLFLWRPPVCWAVEGGLSISPPFVSLTIGEEKEVRQELVIKNDSKQSLSFKVKVVDFGSMDESGGIAFLETKYGLASWLSLEKDALIVGPGEKETLGVTVLNKESLSPGGHYGAVWLMTDEAEGTGKIGLSMSYASLFYVIKNGGAHYSMDLKGVSFGKNWWKRPVGVDLRFQNTGNVHLVPRGLIEVFDSGGRKVAKGVVNDSSAIILPESFRIYETNLNYLTKWWWPGRYRLEVSYRYEGRSDFEKKEYFGNYWPWWLLALPGLFVFVFFLIVGKKRRLKLDTQ